MTDPTPPPPADPRSQAERTRLPEEQPARTQPPPSGCCRVWLHGRGGGTLKPLGDYAESSPRAAAVAAFDQLDGKARRTFVCQDSAGTLTAWTVRLRPATPLDAGGSV